MAVLTGNCATQAVTAPLRVRLKPIRFHHTTLDGCWWPRSSDPAAALPALVQAVDDAHGPVARLLLSAAGWTNRPHQIVVAGRPVSIGYFAGQSPSLLTVIRSDGGTLAILVVSAAPTPDAPGRPGTGRAEAVWEGEGGGLGTSRQHALR
jgi:hypothetical protein